MNTVITSRQEIIEASKQLAAQRGLQSISIRQVAAVCGVSVGSIYNYFTCKADLVMAVIESVWRDTFHMSGSCADFRDFVSCIDWVFECMCKGTKEYPEFFTTYVIGYGTGEREDGYPVMDQYFDHMRKGLLQALSKDAGVKPKVFDDRFTREAFSEHVFSNILLLLIKRECSCNILKEAVRRIIYESH